MSGPTSPEASHRHVCGCPSKGVVRLQSTSGQLRNMIAQAPEEDTLDTVINVAVIGGAAYLAYKIFFE